MKENEYLCSYSAERIMTEADVEELNNGTYEEFPQGKGIIQMVVNEMYARHGFEFTNEEIQAYFNQKTWYQNINVRSNDMNAVVSEMSDTERANVEFLAAYIEG